jgi:flagellar hook protein FlgE
MIKSLYSAVTGLKSQQTRMDVIANNIANVSTNAFKSSRVIFKDIYYQTLSNATAPSANKSGTNPQQVGFGTQVASIDVQNTRSGMQQTDKPSDLYISGDGYFTVKDGSGDTSYTRLGHFSFDVSGNLVDTNGSYVCGGTPSLTTPITIVSTINIPNISDYSNVSIGKDGTISGVNSTTGVVDTLGQIALAKFPNADALSQNGNLYCNITPNSGLPKYAIPGSNATGSLVSGGLEMSNVDLSKEFTDMITTQRSFQANARVITTSDEILQELVGLKR